MKLTIVTSLYGSEAYIEKFYAECSKACSIENITDIEFVIVDDGSYDASNEIVKSMVKNQNNINLIELSRNYGHHEALFEGLKYADGDYVFLIDCDLEEDPNWFSSLFDELNNNNLDVVYGVQRARRKEGALYRFLSRVFYKIFRILTDIDQPNDILTCRIMNKKYIAGLLQFEEREINMGGLFLHAGYKQSYIEFDKKTTSPTTYTLTKKASHFINAITSFSSKPLYLSFYLGLFVTILSFSYVLFLLIKSQLVITQNSGYWSIILSIWFFSGLILFMIGIQGIYLSKIFLEVKRRPRVIVSDKLGPKFDGS